MAEWEGHMGIESDHRARVLIVEDEPDLRELIENNLRASNFDVEAVGSIAAARTLVDSTAFDLMIVDMNLPDGNGVTFSQQLRASSGSAVIVITGGGDETDRILGLELGADDYIQKPFLQRELLARARAVLRRYNHSQSIAKNDTALEPRTIHFHGYALNPTARTVKTLTGESVDLTTLEFDVLAKLASHPNTVFSREEIYKSAAFRTGDPGRLVDGLISRLRKKLYDDAVAKEHIKTIHGRGYALTA
jgi:DNA-binding response OmpR family regulator